MPIKRRKVKVQSQTNRSGSSFEAGAPQRAPSPPVVVPFVQDVVSINSRGLSYAKKQLADPIVPSVSTELSGDAPSIRRSFDDVSLIGSGFGPYEESIRSAWTPALSPARRDEYPLDPYDAALLDQYVLNCRVLVVLDFI